MSRQPDAAGDTGPPDPRRAREAEVRALAERGELHAAATRALELYGAEVLGFLHALGRDGDLADEAFGAACEDLWRGLPGFRWEASLRTWLYALARHALHRVRRDPRRRPERNVALSADPAVAAAAADVRTQTLPFLRSEVKDELRRLREALDPDDHALLILRVDRRLSWRDIARAMPDDAGDIDRRAAALRKRFERVKATLRAQASARGVTPGG
jgi:RNA polymerase sigma-70 factor (ECF subfamily)